MYGCDTTVGVASACLHLVRKLLLLITLSERDSLPSLRLRQLILTVYRETVYRAIINRKDVHQHCFFACRYRVKRDMGCWRMESLWTLSPEMATGYFQYRYTEEATTFNDSKEIDSIIMLIKL